VSGWSAIAKVECGGCVSVRGLDLYVVLLKGSGEDGMEWGGVGLGTLRMVELRSQMCRMGES
jgi:hypothetical protein